MMNNKQLFTQKYRQHATLILAYFLLFLHMLNRSSKTCNNIWCREPIERVCFLRGAAFNDNGLPNIPVVVNKNRDRIKPRAQQQQSTKEYDDSDIHTRVAVISGPSGVGKGTLLNGVLDRYPEEIRSDGSKSTSPFGFSVSHTTRKARPGEIDGVHYHFSTREIMEKMIQNDEFIEYAEVHGNLYGTSYKSVDMVQEQGKICIMDIDIQGFKRVQQSHLHPVSIFIAPPSLETLEKRLRARGTETEDSLAVRTGNAARELEFGLADGNFDYVIVNHNIEEGVDELESTLKQRFPHLVIPRS